MPIATPIEDAPRARPAAATLLLALLPAVVLLLTGCGEAEGQNEGPRPDGTVPAVEAVEARLGALPLRERLTGTVRATGQVAIYPEASGLVVEVMVENGERVERGRPLVRLRATGSQAQLGGAEANLQAALAQVRQARADVEELEAQFGRTEQLARDTLVSAELLETQRARLEAARAGYESAQAQVAQARAQVEESREALRQTVVRAPIAGRVGQRDVEVGMRVDGSTHLFTIGRLEEVRVEVPVTQAMLSRLREGQTATIRLENRPDTVLTAEVSRISPFLEEGSFSAEAEIDVPNPGGLLRPGMFVAVDVFYGESEQATLVPTSALYEDPGTGRQGVFTAPSLGTETQPAEPTDPAAETPLTTPTPTRFQPVEVRAEGGGVVGLDGVEPGTWVVVVGQHLLAGRGADGPAEARVRPVTWERIVGLQRLQRQDLLRQFMDKQQRLARRPADSLGA